MSSVTIMGKIKFILFRYCLVLVMLVFLIIVYSSYKERIVKICNNIQLLSDTFIGPSSNFRQKRIFYVDTRELDSLITATETTDLQEIRKDTGLVYVPASKRLLENEHYFVSRFRNRVTANYYVSVIDYHLWLGKLVPETLWGSYKAAIEYDENTLCKDMSNSEVAGLINLFFASTGDLFNIAAESTNYYIDEKGRNIMIIHELSFQDNNNNERTYYQGYLKAERGEELVNLYVQNKDFRMVYTSLIKSSLSLKTME